MLRGFADARIGIDLDNTLISYERLFLALALESGLISTDFRGSKRDIRDFVRSLPNGEVEWQRLQAAAYGSAISGASPSDGALAFIREARLGGAEVMIVSHKTRYANASTAEPINLHAVAHTWLVRSGIVGEDAVPEDHVYFEFTRGEKIRRVRDLGCTHFIDDLEEVFDDATFPLTVERMLFSPKGHRSGGSYRAYTSFDEIAHAFAS